MVSRPRVALQLVPLALFAASVASLVAAIKSGGSMIFSMFAAFGFGGALLSFLLRTESRRATFGAFELDRSSLRIEGEVVARRRHIRWVTRPTHDMPGWSVHRRWYQTALRIEFDTAADDARFGLELGEHVGTPPAWGASPVRIHMWIAMLAALISVAVPIAVGVVVGDYLAPAIVAAIALLGIVLCPTRLSLEGGELREAWLWGVRRVAIDDVVGHEYVAMDRQEPVAQALRVRLRDGRTRHFGIGTNARGNSVVDALERELELRRTTRILGEPPGAPVAADRTAEQMEEPDVESRRPLKASAREP